MVCADDSGSAFCEASPFFNLDDRGCLDMARQPLTQLRGRFHGHYMANLPLDLACWPSQKTEWPVPAPANSGLDEHWLKQADAEGSRRIGLSARIGRTMVLG